MPVGTTRQYSAQLFDRRGNPVTHRPLSWSSSNPIVISIDDAGMATALGLGTSQISATTGQALAALHVQVRALPPVVLTDSAAPVVSNGATVHATVNPNRVTAEYWYEYGTDSTFVIAQNTPMSVLPAGELPVGLTAQLTGLSPLTRYYARALGRNAGGTTAGNFISFVTPASPRPPEPPGYLRVITSPASNVTFSSATISGSVRRGHRAATAWLEWSELPTFEQFTATPAVNVGAGSGEQIVAANLDDLETGATYYVRAAARIPGYPVYYGQTVSFRTLSGCNGNVANQVTVSSVGCARVVGDGITIPAQSRVPARRQE
jgi:hypothetical protein